MPRSPGRAIFRFVIFLAVAGALAAGGWFFYFWWTIPTVTCTEAVKGPVVQAFYATGTLLPDREYPIKSNVEGIVTEVLVDKGVAVKKGDKLALVRVEEYLMRHSQAKADYELKKLQVDEAGSPVLREYDAKLKAAMEQLAIAQRDLERIRQLHKTKDAAINDLDRSQDKWQTVWSIVESIKAQKAARKLELARDLEVARAALDIAEWNLQEQTIRSPIEGVVLDRPVSVGTRVKINDAMMAIADVRFDRLVMRAQVDEEDKTRLCADQRVKMTLYAYGARVFEGRVRRIYPKADPNRRTFEVDVAMTPADTDFAAGMTGELAFIVQEKDQAIVVPSQAVRAGELWLLTGDRVEPRRVETGLRSVERTEITAGVNVGDRVVVSPADHLSKGRIVRALRIDPSEAAGLNKPAATSAFKGFH